jgi:hypothetical protein
MFVPSTADGSQSDVSVLPFRDKKESVSLHTFTLPEDRCLQHLLKTLSRSMPKSVVLEELKSVIICVHGVTRLRSVCRDQDSAKYRFLLPLYCISRART